MREDILKKYAALVVRVGVNLQPSQPLVIRAPIGCAAFVRALSAEAFAAGAYDVAVHWSDEVFERIRYQNAPMERFEEFPAWRKLFYDDHAGRGAAFISIAASDPDIFSDIAPEKLTAAQLPAEVGKEPAVPCVDRRNPLESLVVSADGEEPFIGNSGASRRIAQEGKNVFGPVRSAVGQQQHGVVGGQTSHLSPFTQGIGKAGNGRANVCSHLRASANSPLKGLLDSLERFKLTLDATHRRLLRRGKDAHAKGSKCRKAATRMSHCLHS